MKIFEIFDDTQKSPRSVDDEFAYVQRERKSLQHEIQMSEDIIKRLKAKIDSSDMDNRWYNDLNSHRNRQAVQERQAKTGEYAIETNNTNVLFVKPTAQNLSTVKALAKQYRKHRDIQDAIKENAKSFANVLSRKKKEEELKQFAIDKERFLSAYDPDGSKVLDQNPKK